MTQTSSLQKRAAIPFRVQEHPRVWPLPRAAPVHERDDPGVCSGERDFSATLDRLLERPSIGYAGGMLTLSLLRHAKSSWDDPRLEDFDRPLSERGREAAPRMARFMAANEVLPEVVLCSPSVRTRQTLELVLPHLLPAPAVAFEDALYLASASLLLQRLRRVAGSVSHLMIVAHDPGLHQLAGELAGSGDPQLLDPLARKLPTGGLAVIDFQAQAWSKVRAGAGNLRIFMTPKRLP
jgi:phosphohistidine phosphatase